MTEKEKRSLKIRLGQRLSYDKSRVMEIVKEEIDKTETTMERPHGEWISKNGKYRCSVCLEPCATFSFVLATCKNEPRDNFCLWCGSDNRKKEDKPHGS